MRFRAGVLPMNAEVRRDASVRDEKVQTDQGSKRAAEKAGGEDQSCPRDLANLACFSSIEPRRRRNINIGYLQFNLIARLIVCSQNNCP